VAVKLRSTYRPRKEEQEIFTVKGKPETLKIFKSKVRNEVSIPSREPGMQKEYWS
jgi:hypothetical protein